MVLLLLAVRAEDVLEIARHPFPFGNILATAINKSGAIAIISLLIILLVIQVLAQLQASSRFVFSLARDNAFPFAEAIRWTNGAKQPVIANWTVILLCTPFCLLTTAGKGTLYSVLAVTAGGLSYWGYVSTPISPYVEQLSLLYHLQGIGGPSGIERRLMIDHPRWAISCIGKRFADGRQELLVFTPVQVSRPCWLSSLRRYGAHGSVNPQRAWVYCTVWR